MNDSKTFDFDDGDRDRQKAFWRKWLAFALALFVVFTVVRFGIIQIRPPGMIPGDYENFHRASDRFIRGEIFYQPSDPSPFKYSPTFILLFRWTFHLIERHAAWTLWCALSVTGFALAVYWLWMKALPFSRVSRRKLALLCGAFLVFAWHGYIEHFSYGQGDMLLFSVFVAAVFASERWQGWKSDVLAALFLALLLITKPQGGLLLSYFLILRRVRLLALVGIFTVLLLLAPALVLGWDEIFILFRFWQACLKEQSVEFLTGNLNQTAAASIARLAHNRDWVIGLIPSFVALGGAATLYLTCRWKKLLEAPLSARIHLACFTLLLYASISPLSWRWFTFIWLPIGLLLSAETISRRRVWPKRLLCAFALNGIVLQTFVAHAMGLREVDDLSWAGLYSLGNALLLAVSIIIIDKQELWLKPNLQARSAL